MPRSPLDHARRIVNQLDRDREILRMLDSGRSPRQIASDLGIDVPLVQLVDAQRQDLVSEPRSAHEIAARHLLGQISHSEMMTELMSRTYTRGRIPDGAYDAWVPGTWDDVTSARVAGLLSDEDFDALLPLAPQ